MKTRVYIAAPYSKGDQAANVAAACRAWFELHNLGFAPFCPHWSHLQHLLYPLPYEAWMSHCFEWLQACDVVLRLPGDSPGADRETSAARRLGIPVFDTLDQLIRWRRQREPTL